MVSDPITTGLLGLAFMFVLIIAQVPVGIAMGVVGVVGTGLIIGFGPALTLLATEPSAAMAAEGLAVIAMFLWNTHPIRNALNRNKSPVTIVQPGLPMLSSMREFVSCMEVMEEPWHPWSMRSCRIPI